MKGMLLLLALLVIGELGFQTTEACVPFIEAFSATASGNKAILNIILSKFNPNAKEREAFEKIQACYNEGGLKTKVLDARVLQNIIYSPECLHYYSKTTRDKIIAVLSKLISL